MICYHKASHTARKKGICSAAANIGGTRQRAKNRIHAWVDATWKISRSGTKLAETAPCAAAPAGREPPHVTCHLGASQVLCSAAAESARNLEAPGQFIRLRALISPQHKPENLGSYFCQPSCQPLCKLVRPPLLVLEISCFSARRCSKTQSELMRPPGVEPGAQAWEACMLPLHYGRSCTAS